MKRYNTILLAIVMMLAFNLTAEGQSGSGSSNWLDVHGAGAQRSDPKSGDPEDYADGHGPQGDAIHILNMVRAVRSLSSDSNSYPVVDTGQTTRFNNSGEERNSSLFYGQDADYAGLAPSYEDNGNGTVTDLNTGLMWQQSPGEKMSWDKAFEAVEKSTLGGYSDWRIPTIKELY